MIPMRVSARGVASIDAVGNFDALGPSTRLIFGPTWVTASWQRALRPGTSVSMFWITFSAVPDRPHRRPEAMKFPGWQRLNAEYAQQFGVAPLDWQPKGGSRVVNRGG